MADKETNEREIPLTTEVRPLDGDALAVCLDYFRETIENPKQAILWRDWWAEHEETVGQAFSLVDYVRLKHRRWLGARQILQLRGELAKDFLPRPASETGRCGDCGENLDTGSGPALCPICRKG